MKNTMTYNVALENAISALTAISEQNVDYGFSATLTAERLANLKETLSKRSGHSEESRAKANAKRKEKVAAARAEMCAEVIPILKNAISTTEPMTAQTIFDRAKEVLPEGFTVQKVRNILMREMKDDVIKTEQRGKANVYTLKV